MLFSDTTGAWTDTEMRISLIVCNYYIIMLFWAPACRLQIPLEV